MIAAQRDGPAHALTDSTAVVHGRRSMCCIMARQRTGGYPPKAEGAQEMWREVVTKKRPQATRGRWAKGRAT